LALSSKVRSSLEASSLAALPNINQSSDRDLETVIQRAMPATPKWIA